MPHRVAMGWLGDRRRAERIFLILFPIMTALFVLVITHRDRVNSDHQIVASQAQAIRVANQRTLQIQYQACLRGYKLRAAVNDAHEAIRDFMTAAVQSVERRSKLETGAKRASDLKALGQYRKFRARFHVVPQVDCKRVIYGKNGKG